MYWIRYKKLPIVNIEKMHAIFIGKKTMNDNTERYTITFVGDNSTASSIPTHVMLFGSEAERDHVFQNILIDRGAQLQTIGDYMEAK